MKKSSISKIIFLVILLIGIMGLIAFPVFLFSFLVLWVGLWIIYVIFPGYELNGGKE
jgi:hypothetical protein